MKKALKGLFIVVLCLSFVTVTFACNKVKDDVDNYDYFDVVGPELDAENASGMSQWSSIPLVSEKLLAEGFSGGEGCQRLVGITRAPSKPDLMFLGTDVGGLFKSTDDGKSWEPCNNGLDRRGVGHIAIDPLNSSHIVVTSTASGESSSKYFAAISYSFDEGNTWSSADGTKNLGVSAAHCFYRTIEFDPSSYDASLGYCTDVYYSMPYERDTDPKTSKAQTAGLYKSTDGGKSFIKYDSQEKLYDAMMVITDGKVVIGNQYGVFAEEGGAFVKKSDLEVQSIKKVGSVYYVLTNAGVYKSGDDFKFEKIESDNFPSRLPRSLEISKTDPDKMILSARKSDRTYSERIYYSHDGGKNWTLVDLGKLEIPGMFFNFTWGVSSYSYNDSVPGEIVGTTSNSVIRSSDYGATWTVSNDGVANAMVGAKFHFNVYNPDLVYVGIQDFGGALSTNGGKTWKKLSLSKDDDGKNIYGGYAADENTIIGVYTEQWANGTKRANERYVCFSHDGGATVNVRKEDLSNPEKASMLASINICNKIHTSYESSYQSPTDKNVLFCGNFRSADYGYTWQNMLDFDTPCLQVYTHYGNTLYGVALGEGYVLKSTDNGLTWNKVNETALPYNANSSQKNHIIDVAVDGQNGYVYAIFCKKLYRMNIDGSDIRDLTKSMAKDNWGTVVLNSVAVDPKRPNVVYCGGSGDMYVSNRGIRRSCDSGLTWQTVSPSLVEDSIVSGNSYGYEAKCIRVHPVTGELWNGSSCLGFNKLTPPYESVAYDSVADVKVYYHLGYDNKVGVYTTKINRKLTDFYIPEREGYAFVGWYSDENGSVTYEFGKALSDSVRLYAKWEAIA